MTTTQLDTLENSLYTLIDNLLHNFTLDTPNIISSSSSPSNYENSSSVIPFSLETPATITQNNQNENLKDKIT